MIEIEFFGVRGSTPCSSDETRRYGGNTSCVVVQVGDDDPIVLDLGTGLRYFGRRFEADGRGPFSGTALLSHLHWDHVQGLPFFVPLLKEGADVEIVGPVQADRSLKEEVCSFIRPPLFPVQLGGLPCHVKFTETSNADLTIGQAVVTVRPIDHCGHSNGYRVEVPGSEPGASASVAYLPDHQQPIDGSLDVPESVIELCADVDVLIHDAQYDPAEFAMKADWGHSTMEYAVAVARASRARRLVLFHHDPGHDDDWVDRSLAQARVLADGDFEVHAASEGMIIRSGADAVVNN